MPPSILRIKVQNKLFLTFMIGLTIRLLIAPYTSFILLAEYTHTVELIYIAGFNPLSWLTTWGPGFSIFYLPLYVPYVVFNYFGFYQPFILNFLFKIPSIAGDCVIFYSLYNIALLLSKSEKVSVSVASAYFLNPFIIQQSAIVGLNDTIAVAFTSLSFLYLLGKKIKYSAICLSIGASIRYISIFLLPVYLIYLRQPKNKPFSVQFFRMFLFSMLVLFSPYLTLIPLFTSLSSTSFWNVTTSFLYGPAALHRTVSNVENIPSIYGFLARLGLWDILPSFVQTNIFFILFIPIALVVITHAFKHRPSKDSVNLYLVVFLSMAALARVISFPDFLVWIFPFLLIEAYVLLRIPRYYTHILWVSALGFSYLTYHPTHHFATTFPLTNFPWPLNAQLGFCLLSVVYPLFLILTTIVCISSILISSRPSKFDFKRLPNTAPYDISKPHIFQNWTFSLLFFGYSLLEILRISYGLSDIVTSFSFFTGWVLIVWLWVLIYRRKTTISGCQHFLSSSFSKLMATIYLGSLVFILLLIKSSQLGNITFLLIQTLSLGTLWLINRRFTTGLNIQRISLVFTAIYVASFFYAQGSVDTGPFMSNIFALISTSFYFFSWIYLLIKNDYGLQIIGK